MHRLHRSRRLALVAFACLAAGGCSFFRHDAKPAAPAKPAAAMPAAASAAAAAPAATPAPLASAPAAWGVVPLRHLDPVAMVGQAWSFPSSDAQLYRDTRFVFRADRVEASNAREHATGTWTVERDKLCITLKSGAACYVVTGTTPGELQIRVLPDGERVPLKIQ